MGKTNPNSVESEPCFCYSGQINDVRAVFSRLFVMSPLNSCNSAAQMSAVFERWKHAAQPSIRQERPIFFFVNDHKNPVPTNFGPMLEKMGAILISITWDRA